MAPMTRMLRKDGGEALRHPLSPGPICDLDDVRYVLFIHNHDGHYMGYGPDDTLFRRRPIYIMHGHFQKAAHQPVWFDDPTLFMEHAGVPLGASGTKGRLDMALYSSFTVRKGRAVLWYPDRKFFLLGRNIAPPDGRD
jgi:hypothetical protein